MIAITFDTLAYSDHLEKAGIPRDQARAQTEALTQAMSGMIQDTLATKRDLNEAKQELKQEISEVRNELKQEISEVRDELKILETKLTVRMGSMLAAGVTILSTLLIILHVH